MKNRTLRITVTADVPVNVPQNVPVKLTSGQGKILVILKENGNVTAVQIAEQLGVSDKTVKRGLSALKEARLIRRIGSDKTGHWEVVLGANSDYFVGVGGGI